MRWSRSRSERSGGCDPGQVTKTAPYTVPAVATGRAASAKGYGRTTAIRGKRRAISSSPPTQTSRRSRTAKATGIGALSPTRSHGAANDLGMPAMTAISSTASSGVSRYTAPEWAWTDSIIEASVSDSSGSPTGVRRPAGACTDPCQSDTPTTSSQGRATGLRDQGSLVTALPARRTPRAAQGAACGLRRRPDSPGTVAGAARASRKRCNCGRGQ